MAPAEEGSYGGSHGRKREPSPDRSHHSPLQDSRSRRRNHENQDGEGSRGRHHYPSDPDSEPHKGRTGRERAYSPASRGSLHRADENRQKRRNEGDQSRLDVSVDPRHKQDIVDASRHHSQRKRDVHDVLLDQRRRSPDIDDAVGDQRLRRQDIKNMSRDCRRKGQGVDDTLGDCSREGEGADDVLGDCSREGEGADDVLGDPRRRRQDVDDVSGDPRRRRQEVDDVSGDQRRRRWDVDSLPGDSSARRQDVEGDLDNRSLRRRHVDDVPDRSRKRWDVDDVLDNVSQDSDDVLGDKNRRRHDVDTLVGDNSQRRRNLDDVPGDSRRRWEVDDGLDNHRRRRRDVDDTFDDRRPHERGGRDRQRRSPHRTSSVLDRRGGNEKRDGRSRQVEAAISVDKTYDGQQRRRTMDNDGRSGRDMEDDRFSARFRNAERDENDLPELFSVHRGKVQSVRPFGIFVRLEGYYKQGLVHLSQLSDHEVTDREDSDERKVQAIAAVAGEGDQVWVKVISLKDEGGSVKIGCSLKLVSQSTGKDLDPNNVKLDQQQPKENRQGPRKVTLDAIYNVVCSRCGGHGHLKTECYGMANKSYELLPDEDDDLTEQPLQPSQPLQAQMLSREVSIKPGFGRGRAMVLPAWMTHGSGANGIQQLGSEPEKQEKKRKSSELPGKAMTVEEAMALIAQVKKEKKDKHHRKEHKKHKKEKRLKSSSEKETSRRKDRG